MYMEMIAQIVSQTHASVGMFEQLVLALSLGLILGIERTVAGRMAGMRTYALVSLGACLLIIISETVTGRYLDLTNFDPMRIAAGIVMGIGFLAGGLIVFQDSKLVGLTTAAGVWVATAIGIAVGFKLYSIAIFTTLLTLFVLSGLWYIEQGIKGWSRKN